MRRLILASALLVLAACNRDQQAAESNGVDQAVTTESIGGNDVTAIDAATNDAANMAADSELMFNAAETNTADANASGSDNSADANEQ